jgi:hypothetical protein
VAQNERFIHSRKTRMFVGSTCLRTGAAEATEEAKAIAIVEEEVKKRIIERLGALKKGLLVKRVSEMRGQMRPGALPGSPK